jgi:hypothetical protein
MKSLMKIVSAGLFVAVFGCQRHSNAHPAQSPRPTPVVANPLPIAKGERISSDTAIKLVMKVHEVEVWSAAVQKAGRHPAFIIGDDVETLDGHDYLSVNVYEDTGDYLTRYATFLVQNDGKGMILVEDDLLENDEIPHLTLEEWRKKRNRQASEMRADGEMR